jgi:hypothetical protein
MRAGGQRNWRVSRQDRGRGSMWLSDVAGLRGKMGRGVQQAKGDKNMGVAELPGRTLDSCTVLLLDMPDLF